MVLRDGCIIEKIDWTYFEKEFAPVQVEGVRFKSSQVNFQKAPK